MGLEDFQKGYQEGLVEEYFRCQNEHQKIIDNIWKFYAKQLGPRKFVELQKKYALENKTSCP